MDDKRNSFTFIWKIKNFSFSSKWKSGFNSPIFFVQAICQTKWTLHVYVASFIIKDSIVCRLQRQKADFGPTRLELDYELSFITGDGSVIHSAIFRNKAYKIGSIDNKSALSANREEVYRDKKNLFIPDDTLTIRCRMWNSQRLISESASCSVETRINTECRSFVGSIEKFSSFKARSKNMVCIKLSSINDIFSMNLCVGDDGKLDIQMKPVCCQCYKFKVFILDVFKNKVKAGQGEMYDEELLCIPLNFSKEYLLKNEELYLSNDVLTLQCEIISLSDNEVEIIDDMLYEYNCQDIQAVINNATNTNQFSKEHHTESITSLKDGLISLFNEGVLCDTKLKTATETFRAHTVVLSAQSPVFKSMFTTDMREKKNSSVDIEDLDADTVRQMLLFMFSDTIDNLDYESAKNLYFAADKYNIVSLRHKCSDFLKQNLLHSNCCEVLILADKHQDKDLKISVRDCIAENDEAVFSSDGWKNLLENHPRMTTEIVLAVYSYMKNRKT